MELRQYWKILKRRLWLIIVALLAFLVSYWLFRPSTPSSFTTSMRFVVGIKPEVSSGSYYTYDRYYTWLTAEYLIDDFSEVVKSAAFAQDVAELAGIQVTPGAIQGATSAGKLHRILTVHVTWHDPQELSQLANAIVEVITNRSQEYFAQLATSSAVVSLIDPPIVTSVTASLRERLDLPLRLLLALGAGIALAFLLDYLDDAVRERKDLEELGITLLAEIPARRGWMNWLWRRRPLP
ncbi:MAG: hypothetical protein A2Y73_05890 [Chloroflexi bacterium RBG_13_56_8]|nr:MAG: hypothetical protein A2Y73_05890 [Chloroflexi bacterium RBG_13_56_8]